MAAKFFLYNTCQTGYRGRDLIEQLWRSRQVAIGRGKMVSPRHPCGALYVEAEQAKEPT